MFLPFAHVGSGDPVRVLRLFHNKVYLYRLYMLGSGDPVRVLHLFHNKVYLYRFYTLGSGDPVRVLRLFHNKVYLYCLYMLGSGDLSEGRTSIPQQIHWIQLIIYCR